MNSKIEQIIDEIEEYIDNCKAQPLSSGARIIVDKETISELIMELRTKVPDEVRRFQRIISNEEAIMASAHAKAEELVERARVQNSEMVSEHEIMQQAYAQANEVVAIATKQAQEIMDNATNDANEIRIGAIRYTDEMLKNTEDLISNSIETSKARTENLVNSLKKYLDIISANRLELTPAGQSPQTEQKSREVPAGSALETLEAANAEAALPPDEQ